MCVCACVRQWQNRFHPPDNSASSDARTFMRRVIFFPIHIRLQTFPFKVHPFKWYTFHRVSRKTITIYVGDSCSGDKIHPSAEIN